MYSRAMSQWPTSHARPHAARRARAPGAQRPAAPRRSPLPAQPNAPGRGARRSAVARATAEDGGESLTAVFAAEVARRQAAEAAEKEAAAAAAFDGKALLALVQQKYGRSYDFSLVQVQT